MICRGIRESINLRNDTRLFPDSDTPTLAYFAARQPATMAPAPPVVGLWEGDAATERKTPSADASGRAGKGVGLQGIADGCIFAQGVAENCKSSTPGSNPGGASGAEPNAPWG